MNTISINLYIPYCMFQNETRNKEIIFAITQNLQLDYINQYYIICENQESFDYIKQYSNEKTVVLLHNQRLTYDDIFQISNKYTTDQSINILINSDIILTNFKEINSFFVKNNIFLCVSRHEKDGQLIHIPHLSQDVWAWKGLNQIKNANFYMGILGCDTAIAYRAIESGYKTINPCRHLIAIHNHISNYRTYDDTRMTFGAPTFPTSICIVRPTYYDRSAMLQLSLEYQQQAEHSDKFKTYIFVDPHNEHGIASDYDKVITDEYKRINWKQNSGKYSWYHSVKYIFDNTDYEYVITIEDDVLISKDYLRMCEQLALHDDVLSKDDNILYFHSGAWEKPKGNPNKIVRSGVSSRSILINRKKFAIITKWVEEKKDIIDNDHMIKDVLDNYQMTTIAPETNRHAHIGIYGWSANHIHGDNRGQSSLFNKPLTHEEMYSLLKENCLSGSKLLELNQYRNPDYFWDFDPDINFKCIIYEI